MNRDITVIGGLALASWLLWRYLRPLTATVTTSETFDTDDYLPGSTNYPYPIRRFAEGIAFAEGFGLPGAIPTVANNPGDLVLPGWSPTLGAGIAVFDSPDYGWYRLYRQLAMIVSGGSDYYYLDMSVREMGLTWAGGDPNWAANVARHLGISQDAKLWEVLA